MKRLVVLSLIGGALALIAGAFARHRYCDCELGHAAACGDSCRWFRYEYGLDEKTCGEIARRHDAFRGECERHCAAVREAGKALDALPAGSPERIGAKQKYDDAVAACVAAREAHFRKIAAMMPPEQGEKYLAYVLPLVEGHDHSHVPGVAGR